MALRARDGSHVAMDRSRRSAEGCCPVSFRSRGGYAGAATAQLQRVGTQLVDDAIVLVFEHDIQLGDLTYRVWTETNATSPNAVFTFVSVDDRILAARQVACPPETPAEERSDAVRALAEDQHRTVMKELVSGKLSLATSDA